MGVFRTPSSRRWNDKPDHRPSKPTQTPDFTPPSIHLLNSSFLSESKPTCPKPQLQKSDLRPWQLVQLVGCDNVTQAAGGISVCLARRVCQLKEVISSVCLTILPSSALAEFRCLYLLQFKPSMTCIKGTSRRHADHKHCSYAFDVLIAHLTGLEEPPPDFEDGNW